MSAPTLDELYLRAESTAEALEEILDHPVDVVGDDDEGNPPGVILYPADIDELLALIGGRRRVPGEGPFASLSGPFIYDERGRQL